MEIYGDTSLTMTHCKANHLTSFAGGLLVIPTQINFEYVLVNVSPLKSHFIYLFVASITTLYIFALIVTNFYDKRDKKK